MNSQTALALGLGLLPIVFAPLAGAHLTQTSPTPLMVVADGGSTSADGCRYLNMVAGACVTNTGPSGTYFNAGNGLFAEAGSMPIGVSLGADELGITFFPNGWYGTGAFGTLCDIEVQSDGNQSSSDDNTLDETTVDSDSSTGGALPDGTFDDGGDGAVCHVRSYMTSTYDTLGCANDLNVSGVAHAEDRVFGGDVWLTANCDWESFANPGGGGLNCFVNELLQGKQPGVLTGCLEEIVADELSPAAVVPVPVCGGDGVSDGAPAYGEGGGDYPGLGVAYPTLTNDCVWSDATASAAVMNSIQAPGPTAEVDVLAGNGCDVGTTFTLAACTGLDAVTTDPEIFGLLHVNGYTMGWIDWNTTGARVNWVDGGGLHAQVLDASTCSDGIDNDLDGEADAADPNDCQGDDASEDGDGDVPQCSNGLDDDGDDLVDAADPGCSGPTDNGELSVPECAGPIGTIIEEFDPVNLTATVRVFCDTNGNGVQDAGEPTLAITKTKIKQGCPLPKQPLVKLDLRHKSATIVCKDGVTMQSEDIASVEISPLPAGVVFGLLLFFTAAIQRGRQREE